MAVNYAPLLTQPGIGERFLLGQQQGRELRQQGQRDNALAALSADPNNPQAINALMAVDPRTAMAFEERGLRQQAEAQAAQRSQAFAGALAEAPGVPQQARDYATQTGDVEGTQQLMALYAKAGEAQKAALKERTAFLADSSRALMGVADIGQRVATGRQLAEQAGLDPNMVTPETVTDTALQAAVGQSLGILKQMEFEDKAAGRAVQMRGQDITMRGQDVSASNAQLSASVQLRGQDMARGNALISAGSQGLGQVVQTADGPIIVDRRTGTASPVIGANGAPVLSDAKLKAQGNARNIERLLSAAAGIIPKSTGSYAGAARDLLARGVGVSTEGSRNIARLKTIEGSLLGAMPRFEGPQSNIDVQFYRQAAGMIADPTIPTADRLAAIETIRAYQAGLTSNGAAPPRIAPGRSTVPGSPVRNDMRAKYGLE